MNADCRTSSTTSSEATLAVCEDFRPLASLTSSQNQEDKPATVQQEFSAFVPPIHKRFKRPYLVMAIAVSAVKRMLKFVVFCLVIPALLIVSAILKVATYAMKRYVAYIRDCTPLREDDAVWRQDRPSNRHIVNALMVIEGAPDIAKLRQIICDRLVYGKDENGERICPRLTQVIEKHLGWFVWKEDEHFTIEKHVLNWEGNSPKSSEDLEVVVSAISSTPLPQGISPWQFLVVPIIEEDCFGVILRVHHSVADGVALARVFVRNLFDVPPLAPEPKKFSTKHRFYMWCKTIVVGPFVVLSRTFSRADASKIHDQEPCGKKVVAWSKNFELALVKRLKNMTGTTVNDVMVSCLAGALHDYLKGQENRKVDKIKDITALLTVDVRASTKSVELKNKFSVVFLRLPIVAKNAVDRLLATKQRMDIIKTSAEPFITFVTVRILMMLPEWVSKPLIDFFSSKTSCVISNVPGPQQTLFLGGQKIIEGIFWVPQRANIGVGLSIFSYRGGIRVGVYADKCVIPNPWEVVKGFEKNLQELVNELNLNEK